MTRVIRHPDDLDGRILRLGDRVEFTSDQHYIVNASFLSATNGYNNAEIFQLLGLYQYDFARLHYGYAPDRGGEWHNFKANDYEAATRVVIALFAELGKVSASVVKHTTTSYTATIRKNNFLLILKSEGRLPDKDGIIPVMSIHKTGRRFIFNNEIYTKESKIIDSIADLHYKEIWGK